MQRPKNHLQLFRRGISLREVLLLGMDIVVYVLSFAVLLLLDHFSGYSIGLPTLLPHLLLLGGCLCLFHFLFHTYKSLWSYAESQEYLTLMGVTALSYVAYLLLCPLLKDVPLIAYTLLAASVSLLMMLMLRFIYRRYRNRCQSNAKKRVPLLIVGAGNAGVMLLDELLKNPSRGYYPVCLVDDDPNKIGFRLRNIPVDGPVDHLPDIVKKRGVEEILIAIPSASRERIREILDLCLPLNCKVHLVPDILELTETSSPSSVANQIRDVSIHDLLGREPVHLTGTEVVQFLSGKVVMVTGGGGSIGSELCRQIAKHHPRQLIVVDVYENNAYDIQQELRYSFPDLNLQIEIASVRDKHKIDRLFEQYRPQVVFHAAAHKHVPLMEHNPEEAIRNNVFGTWNVACAADTYRAENFVLISTDKAVNPTNVMGASKRLCEMVVQGVASHSDTRYAAVRFGNVLGSNGSVIPLFQRQISHGGPVTITDKRIIRYFMTIPEAAQLVLQAGAMAKDSEVFVLDMGNPVSILELAENLIRLSGLTPYTDIPIVETGLRPGEKLYEELLMQGENLLSTANRKIFIEQQREPLSLAQVEEKLAALESVLKTDSPSEIIAVMKQLVPTYRSPEEVNAAKTADLNYSNMVSNAEPATIK